MTPGHLKSGSFLLAGTSQAVSAFEGDAGAGWVSLYIFRDSKEDLSGRLGVGINQVEVIDDPEPGGLFIAEGGPIACLPRGETAVLSAIAFVDQNTINTAIVSGTVPAGVCSATDQVTVEVVEPPVPATSCDDSKLTALVLEHRGEDCSASNHQQPSEKFTCTGVTGLLGEPVEIVPIKDPDKIGVTPAGETFLIGDLVRYQRLDGNSFAAGYHPRDPPGRQRVAVPEVSHLPLQADQRGRPVRRLDSAGVHSRAISGE